MARLDYRFALVLGSTLLVAACGGGDGEPGEPQPLVFTDFQQASVVIGQAGFTGQDANRGGLASSNTLSGPFGPTAEGSWFVVDGGNNRVLGYDTLPEASGAQAAFVLGQPTFTSTAPDTSALGMRLPSGIAVGDGRLAVADTDNHRVLIWNTIPQATGVAPDVVVGQADFTSQVAATAQNGLRTPSAVFLAGGRLFVTDTGNRRVLIWNAVPAADQAPADVVLGQPDFVTGGAQPLPTGLSFPAGLWSDGVKLVLADGNHRVLIWNAIPTVDDTPADVVVGQPDLLTSQPSLGPKGLEFPRSVWANATQLIVADANHHRVLIYTPFPTANHAAATTVLGHAGYDHQTPNDDDQDGTADATPSARTMRVPSGVMLIGSRLVVSDRSNHRVLIIEGQ